MSDMVFHGATIYGAELSRRSFLAVGGALVVYAGLSPRDALAQAAKARNSLDPTRSSSWIEIRSDNTVQFRTGKCDFGQSSIYIAYPQIIAEELSMPLEAITSIISGDTDRTPDGGGTFGLLRTNVVNLRKAAAYTREAILELAAQRFGVPKAQLTVNAGVVSGGGKSLTYGKLVQGQDLKLVIPVRGNATDFSGLIVDGDPPLKPVASYSIVGKPFKNPGIASKVKGETLWATDVKLPGMWHGRVVHPPTLGSTLVKAGTLDASKFRSTRLVVQGNFVGVVAPTEWEAIQAAIDVTASTQWTSWKGLPGHDKLFEHLKEKADWSAFPATRGANKGDPAAAIVGAAKTHSASYEVPYLKHAPIGPAVALADVRRDGLVTVHTNTQNPQFLRKGLAVMLSVPVDQVVVRTYAGSGHYGRSNGGNAGAEDQAVLLSKAVGRPVRLQWMRAEDLQWSTQGSAMYSNVQIGLDPSGRVLSYRSDHFGPPTQDDRLVGALLAGLPTIPAPGVPGTTAPHQGELLIRDPWLYQNVPHVAEAGHGTWQLGEHESPLKVGLRDHTLRTPIQFQQNFPREVAMTEAAALAGVDALQFRIDQTSEPRVKDILARLRDASEWQTRGSPSPDASAMGDRPVSGRGASVTLRDNGYWACAAHVSVTPSTGAVKVERMTVVVDPGIVVNPLQLKRQVEAGCLMGVSIALHEEVTFDEGAITIRDWGSYPILKMAEMPEVRVVLVHRPETGVHGQGSEAANALAPSAIASAIFDATGKPVRRLPLRPDIVKRAMSA